MPRRRNLHTGTIGYDLNKMSQELRRAVLDVGVEILGELAEKVAEEANLRAPFIEHDIDSGEEPLRRGPNKFGKSDSGPIKGNVFARESKNVPLSWLVVSPAWYSHFLEYGTQIHEMPIISRKRGRFMIFPGTNEFEGQKIFAKKVIHPGLRPSPPFMRPAADKAEQFLEEILSSYGFKRK